MKKITAIILSMGLAMCLLAGCGSTSSETTTTAAETTAAETTAAETTAEEATGSNASGEIVVFAAASMTETLTEIIEEFKEVDPDVTVTVTFDSSGTLKTQIEEGAACDIFISAGQKQMNQLDIEADASVNTDGLDFVETSTRFNLLENKVVLAVPEGNPAKVESFDGLIDSLKAGSVKLAIGNSDVPVGQYTQKIFTYYEIALDESTGEPTDATIAGCLTYGTNVKEVTTQVTEGTVDCGIVYATDAFSAGLEWVDEATKDMCGQVIYPAAMLKQCTNTEAAQDFLDFLTSDTASEILSSVGFTPLN